GEIWRTIFDYRKMLTIPALKGIYLYHEFIGPVIPLDSVVYLGEGHTPIVEANDFLQQKAGVRFYFKNDGQNPSASFKDRGMASALSYIHFLVQKGCISDPQQLSQPLGSGAWVFEIPGVFDDCMKVVEALSENYNVALLNSKNAWRILGQESYSYEIAQSFEYDMEDKVVVLPIGNAGNITAVISGFLRFYETGIITSLPKILGVQSQHANPVYRYYLEPDAEKRKFRPVTVKSSVAQAAMIGNPVSMPRVIHLVDAYNRMSDRQNVFFVEVAEQSIMDWELLANRNGHIACTHGGESLAGLVEARKQKIVGNNDVAVVDSTAHALKFSGFQEMYFEKSFPAEFEIVPDPALMNAPVYIHPKDLPKVPAPGKPLKGAEFDNFVERISEEVATRLSLKKVLKA
ncbi:MAG: pyridoxal-phosphate dependent enzyme, partial [Deltaproteobacteria bacterium]|nr:pyridoxal-phosphate dependent enzyme [Deltaproteobacteria bacterium]